MNFSYARCTVAVVFAAFMCIIESQLERCIISPTGSTGLSVIVDLSLSHIKRASAATYVLLNQAHCVFARLGRIFLSFQNRCCQQKSFHPLLFFCLYLPSMRTFPVTSPPAPFSLASAFCCSQRFDLYATCHLHLRPNVHDSRHSSTPSAYVLYLDVIGSAMFSLQHALALVCDLRLKLRMHCKSFFALLGCCVPGYTHRIGGW